jgi:hypothetical protein
MWRFSLYERARSSGAGEKQTLLHMLVPGIAAIAVFAAAGVFLFQYSQQSSLAPAPVAPYDWEASRPTIEESAEMSHEKVVAAGSPSGISEPVMTGMLFAAAVVAGFFVYVAARYRSQERVLEPEQVQQAASGTQDYPERLP